MEVVDPDDVAGDFDPQVDILPAPKDIGFRPGPYWRLWRLYGHLIFKPARRFWYTIHQYSLVSKGKYGVDWQPKYNWTPKLKNWIESKRSNTWLKQALYVLLLRSYVCPHCGDDNWLEDEAYPDEERLDDRTKIPTFELVNSGQSQSEDGNTYWWEGWRWCYRCGHHEWSSDST